MLFLDWTIYWMLYFYTEADETFYSFTLTVQSSRELSCSRILLSNFPYLLADAFICCAKKFGSRKQYSMKGKYDDISTITLSLGLGYCTVVENLSSSYVEFQMSSQTSHNYTSTRGTLQTCDKLPPYHRSEQFFTLYSPKYSYLYYR